METIIFQSGLNFENLIGKKGVFFSESEIRFDKSPTKIIPNHYPELEI